MRTRIYFERDVYQDILKWKRSEDNTSLFLTGPRQVDTTYLLQKLGEEEFSHLVYINLVSPEDLTKLKRKCQICSCLVINAYVYNFPTVPIDGNETPTEAAARELREETGLTITKVIKELEPSYLCAPVIDELTTVIVCEATGAIQNSDSPDEEIYAEWFTKEEVRELLESGNTKVSGMVQAFCYGWVYGF